MRRSNLKPGVNDLLTVAPHAAAEISVVDPTLVYAGITLKVPWRCQRCGFRWFSEVRSRGQKGYGCAKCATDAGRWGRVRTNTVKDVPSLARYLLIVDPSKIARGSRVKVPWICERNHTWMSTPNNRRKSGCPVCSGQRVNPGATDLKTVRPDLANQLLLVNPERVTSQSSVKAPWICSEGHVWWTWVYSRFAGNDCPRCSAHVSRGELEMAGFIVRSVNGTPSFNQKILSGREVDVFVPEVRVAIEFNGVYYHSEKFRGKNYHRAKTLAAEKAGIQLVHVWEDDWRDRREVVERMLARKLGVSTEERLNARSLRKVRLETEEARTFLEENHVQGFARGSEYYGLSDGFLRAVLVMKNRGDGNWELVRYATSAIVRGGHSRLFKWFQDDHPEVPRVVTFADRGVSDGGLYEKCGFQRDGELPPDYMYVVGGRREHKFNYRKSRFESDPRLEFKPGLTERQLAELNGLERIYDAGKVRYAWTR